MNTSNRESNIHVSLRDIQKKLPLRVMSKEQWAHWTTWGYVVIPEVVPAQNIEHLKALLWDFQEMDPDDNSTWAKPQFKDHAMTELNNSGMVEIYNHQYLWDNRQDPLVYNAFVDIWDRADLWVTIDRANLNTPNRGGRDFSGFIHWDVDTSLRPLPIGVQGVLSLVDVDEEVGGFQCVPELFRTFDDWEKSQPADRDPWHPDTSGFEIVPVPMKAGDMLVFNSLLAHGIKPNTSTSRVRMAQYIAMFPADESNVPEVETRIRSWKEREAPKKEAFPGDPRGKEKQYDQARLTGLGRRLLGIDKWS
jgi:ectoine hydroxylase-related dioxygenase (phytanoyl-CoA dioxygenase family)